MNESDRYRIWVITPCVLFFTARSASIAVRLHGVKYKSNSAPIYGVKGNLINYRERYIPPPP